MMIGVIPGGVAGTVTRRLSSHLAAALVFALCGTGCGLFEPSENCGSEEQDDVDISAPFAAPDPEVAQITGAEVRFAWGRGLSGICSEGSHSDTAVEFNVFVDPTVAEPAGFTITGNVYTAAFIQPRTARAGKLSQERWNATVTDLGLKQGNPEGGAATISNELVVSFTSSGNLTNDRATAARYIRDVGITTTYRKAK
jgi:hypothetical protein